MTDALFDVTDRVALVTGSSRGIGYALARGLLHAGADVVINGRDGAALTRAQTQLAEQTGRTPHIESFDVTREDAVAASTRPRALGQPGGGPPAGLARSAAACSGAEDVRRWAAEQAIGVYGAD